MSRSVIWAAMLLLVAGCASAAGSNATFSPTTSLQTADPAADEPSAFTDCGIGPGGTTWTGPINGGDQAIAAARTASGLREPIVIRDVRHGRARDVFRGAYPSFDSEEAAAAFQRRLDRQAWAVRLTAMLVQGCGPNAPLGESTIELVLDAETGTTLFAEYTDPR